MAGLVSHQDMLEDYWTRGLTGTTTSEQKLLAAELSSKTGLTVTQIQVPTIDFKYLKLAMDSEFEFVKYAIKCIFLRLLDIIR